MGRPQKITFEMREMGIRGVLTYCSDYKCSLWQEGSPRLRLGQAGRSD